jgi:succinate dehydrogenase / fumarate reductase membrane anchor subunit
MVSYRTPLGRARGLGSAKHGVDHWLGEQVASLVLVLLAPWAIWSALVLTGADTFGVDLWLSSPIHAVLSLILVAVGFYYLHAAMRVVIEDYIHGVAKAGALLLNLFVCGLGGALAAFCVLKVAFTSGAF